MNNQQQLSQNQSAFNLEDAQKRMQEAMAMWVASKKGFVPVSGGRRQGSPNAFLSVEEDPDRARVVKRKRFTITSDMIQNSGGGQDMASNEEDEIVDIVGLNEWEFNHNMCTHQLLTFCDGRWPEDFIQVLKKLASLGITSMNGLRKTIPIVGLTTINKILKANGHKVLNRNTVQAIKRFGQYSHESDRDDDEIAGAEELNGFCADRWPISWTAVIQKLNNIGITTLFGLKQACLAGTINKSLQAAGYKSFLSDTIEKINSQDPVPTN